MKSLISCTVGMSIVLAGEFHCRNTLLFALLILFCMAAVPDRQGGTATATVECPTITLYGSALGDGSVGYSYSQFVHADGGQEPYSYSLFLGTLPPGLALGATTGNIAGTPTTTGHYSFTIRARDTNDCFGSQVYTIDVGVGCPTITLSPGRLPEGTTGVSYSQHLYGEGGTTPHTCSLFLGTLPPGLTLSPDCDVAGTPTTAGSYSFTARVKDGNNCLGIRVHTIDVVAGCPPITVSPFALPDAWLNASYSQTLSASGGVPPHTFSIIANSLPAGLTLAATSRIIGTATTAGTYSFIVEATDSNQCNGVRSYTIGVDTPFSPTHTWTPTDTPTRRRTPTTTSTRAHTATRTTTWTPPPTFSPTRTLAQTAAPTRTATATHTPSSTGTETRTLTRTATRTVTPAATASASRSVTPGGEETIAPTATHSATTIATATRTIAATATMPTAPPSATPPGAQTAIPTASATYSPSPPVAIATATPPAPSPTPTPSPTPPAVACTGDCDGSGEVRIDELVRGVSMALGRDLFAHCPAFDANHTGRVEIDELVDAVGHALRMCP